MSNFVLPHRAAPSSKPSPIERARLTGSAASMFDHAPKFVATAPSDTWSEETEKKTFSLYPGWVCLGLGTVLCWFFLSAHAFFVGGLVFGIVAMSKNGRASHCTAMIVGSLLLPMVCIGLQVRFAMVEANKKAEITAAKMERDLQQTFEPLSRSLKKFSESAKQANERKILQPRKNRPNPEK